MAKKKQTIACTISLEIAADRMQFLQCTNVPPPIYFVLFENERQTIEPKTKKKRKKRNNSEAETTIING